MAAAFVAPVTFAAEPSTPWKVAPQMMVKRTFIELVEPDLPSDPLTCGRVRALTESAAVTSTDEDRITACSEEAVAADSGDEGDGESPMAATWTEPEIKITVKRTFIEIEESDPLAASPMWHGRVRAFTDSVAAALGRAYANSEDSTDVAPSSEASASSGSSVHDFMMGESPMLAAWAEPETPPLFHLGDLKQSPVVGPAAVLLSKPPGCWFVAPAATAPVSTSAQPDVEGYSALMAVETSAEKTTLMLRNVPTGYSRQSVIELLEDEGFDGCFDFVYMPMDFSSSCSLGYCFVNFVSAGDAVRCWRALTGFSNWGRPCEKVCEVTWSDPQQGLASNIQRYRNSPVMHTSVPDLWKPALFQDGVRIDFPPPTKALKAPKQMIRKGSRR